MIGFLVEDCELTNTFSENRSRGSKQISPTDGQRYRPSKLLSRKTIFRDLTLLFPSGAILSRVYLQHKRQAPSMKVANSAILWCAPAALRRQPISRRGVFRPKPRGGAPVLPRGGREAQHRGKTTNRQLILLSELSNRWGKLQATRETAPIQMPKSWR
jgi:hypothetical protein